MTERPSIEEPSEESLREILIEVYGLPDQYVEDILGRNPEEQHHRFECFLTIHERLANGDGDGEVTPLDPPWTPELWRHFVTEQIISGEFNEGTSKVPGREIMVNIFELWKSEGPGRAMEVILNYYAFLDGFHSESLWDGQEE